MIVAAVRRRHETGDERRQLEGGDPVVSPSEESGSRAASSESMNQRNCPATGAINCAGSSCGREGPPAPAGRWPPWQRPGRGTDLGRCIDDDRGESDGRQLRQPWSRRRTQRGRRYCHGAGDERCRVPVLTQAQKHEVDARPRRVAGRARRRPEDGASTRSYAAAASAGSSSPWIRCTLTAGIGTWSSSASRAMRKCSPRDPAARIARRPTAPGCATNPGPTQGSPASSCTCLGVEPPESATTHSCVHGSRRRHQDKPAGGGVRGALGGRQHIEMELQVTPPHPSSAEAVDPAVRVADEDRSAVPRKSPVSTTPAMASSACSSSRGRGVPQRLLEGAVEGDVSVVRQERL